MTNELDEDVVDVPEIVPTQDDEGTDTTDWKALAEERHALAVKNQGIAKRYKTKADKAKEPLTPPAPPVEKKEPKSDELDYGQKAFLRSYDIKGADELELAKNWVARTGDNLDVMVEDSIFQAKLTSLRDARASKQAVPPGSKRASPSAKDDVEQWIDKPFEEVPANLKAKVVNARIARDKDKSMFTATPVIGG